MPCKVQYTISVLQKYSMHIATNTRRLQRPAVDVLQRPAVDVLQRPAVDALQGPAVYVLHRPAVDVMQRPAVDALQRPAGVYSIYTHERSAAYSSRRTAGTAATASRRIVGTVTYSSRRTTHLRGRSSSATRIMPNITSTHALHSLALLFAADHRSVTLGFNSGRKAYIREKLNRKISKTNKTRYSY